MRTIDPGHHYHLRSLDGEEGAYETLQFVKREGEGYPGNVGTNVGTTTQEVLRALIDRCNYVNNQIPCLENVLVNQYLRLSIYALESRAALRHGRELKLTDQELAAIESLPTCSKCNHIGCEGECRNEK